MSPLTFDFPDVPQLALKLIEAFVGELGASRADAKALQRDDDDEELGELGSIGFPGRKVWSSWHVQGQRQSAVVGSCCRAALDAYDALEDTPAFAASAMVRPSGSCTISSSTAALLEECYFCANSDVGE